MNTTEPKLTIENARKLVKARLRSMEQELTGIMEHYNYDPILVGMIYTELDELKDNFEKRAVLCNAARKHRLH